MLRIVWQGPQASQILHFGILLATPMDTTYHVLSAHAHNLAQYVGKGRRDCSARGMCSIEL